MIGAVWVLLCVFFIGFGAYTAWDSYYRLPHRYAALRHTGVRATANLIRCAPRLGGGNGVGCRISLSYAGHRRTWNYAENSSQFERLPPGAAIPVLVDPKDTSTVFTVRDVAQETDAGIGSPLLWFGVGLVAIGMAGLAWLVRLVAI
jgi:hypothetical protein